MEKQQRKNMLWRIPLALTILIAFSWGICYLMKGEVPIVSQVESGINKTTQLPFSISRLWDIPFTFIWSFILVFLFTRKKFKDEDGFLNLYLILGLFIGSVISIAVNPVVGLSTSLIMGAALTLFACVHFEVINAFIISLFFGLGAGLSIGILIGLGPGLLIALSICLIDGMVAQLLLVLFASIEYLFSVEFKNWLAGK